LIPFEIIASRVIESGLTESGEINRMMYRKLLESAYDDGIITDMERNILNSSAAQYGLSPQKASDLESEVKRALGIDPVEQDLLNGDEEE